MACIVRLGAQLQKEFFAKKVLHVGGLKMMKDFSVCINEKPVQAIFLFLTHNHIYKYININMSKSKDVTFYLPVKFTGINCIIVSLL